MHPLLMQERANAHRRDLLQQAETAALIRSARAANRRHRRPRWSIPSSMGRCLGVLLIRAGGRLVAQRRPEPAPCPWCDLAYPRSQGPASTETEGAPQLVGVSPRTSPSAQV